MGRFKASHEVRADDGRFTPGVSRDTPGKSAKETGAVIGVSDATVARARAVNVDAEAKAAVESGQQSINAAYKQTQEKKRHAKAAAPPAPVTTLLPEIPVSALRGVYTVAEWTALSARDRT